MQGTSSETRNLVAQFVNWAASVTVRQAAIETLLREKLNITEEQWKKAVDDARRHSPSHLRARHSIVALESFLQGLAGM
jgi:hypothetical protein